MGWSVQLRIVKCLLVGRDDTFKAINSWVEDISVHCETMRCSVRVWWDRTSESVELNLLVSVVELQDRAYTVDSLEVLVLVWVEEVERVTGSWVTI